jgi:hypothetical protein
MCDFCKAITDSLICHETQRSQATEKELQEFGTYESEYTVAIVERSWYTKRGKKSASRTVRFKSRGIGFKLNYCPECGRSV